MKSEINDIKKNAKRMAAIAITALIMAFLLLIGVIVCNGQQVYEIGYLTDRAKPKYQIVKDTAFVNKVVSNRIGVKVNAIEMIKKSPPYFFIETPAQKLYVIRGKMVTRKNGKKKFKAEKRGR